MHDVALTVNRKKYGGWTSVRISRGMEQMSGAFNITYTERWPGQSTTAAWPIKPGDACVVSIDNVPVITGYVDDVSPQFDANGHTLSLSGRDATGDLVDCSVASSPGAWSNRTVAQIVADIVRPFGIPLTVSADVGAKINHFAVEEGETAYDAIERLCRYRGILPVSDGLGGLVLATAGTTRLPVALVEGVNILSGQGQNSLRDRYKTYTVKGCDVGLDDSTPPQNCGPSAVANDPGVIRYRPLTIIAENPANVTDLKKRAIWEAAVRKGRANRAMITVQGWTHSGGLWQPNTLLPVKSPMLKINADMLIVSVSFSRDHFGTLTKLEVCDPAGLTPEIIPVPVSQDET